MVPGNLIQPVTVIFAIPGTVVTGAQENLVGLVTGQLKQLEVERRNKVVQEPDLPNLPEQLQQGPVEDLKPVPQQDQPKGQLITEGVKDKKRTKAPGGEIKEQKGQVAMENVQQPKLVVPKGQKGPKPLGNKLVPWPLVNSPNNRGHPSKLWSNLSPKPKKPQVVEAAIRPVGPGEAEHVPGAPWKCVLMFALHFPPAFLELVLEVVLNGVLLRNKKNL